jgi:hypothetical protein
VTGHRQRAFENSAVKKDDKTRKWRRLHYEELYDLYYSPELFW